MANILKTEGIVISRRGSYNQDIYLTLMTREEGRMDVIAKRSKSYKSALNAASRTFVCAEYILLTRYKTPVVQSADILSANFEILDSLNLIGCASYIAEITIKTLPENVPEERIYYLLKESLALLAEGKLSTLKIRAHYIYNLCFELGLSPADALKSGEMGEGLRMQIGGDKFERLLKFFDYLGKIEPRRLFRTNVEDSLLKQCISVCESVLAQNFGIDEIKSNAMLDL